MMVDRTLLAGVSFVYNDLVNKSNDALNKISALTTAAYSVAAVAETYAITKGVAAAGRLATRYMGEGEAGVVERTGTIPGTDAAGRGKVVHYTTDSPTSSAAEAMQKYDLPSKPSHMVRFPVGNVQNSVVPTGPVAADATQAATSRPINGAGRPVPLDP